MIFRKPCQIATHTCMWTTLAFFINIRTLRKSKMFHTKNLRMCANGLLITSCQNILVKMKLNAFFSVEKRISRGLNITNENNRVKPFNIVEYLGCSSLITLVRQGYKIHDQFSENCYWLVIGNTVREILKDLAAPTEDWLYLLD